MKPVRIEVDFDEDGPLFGAVRLLAKTAKGFEPRSTQHIAKLFANRSTVPFDIERFERGLISIAHAMNAGDLGLAAIISGRLPFPRLTEADLTKIKESDRLLKARVDDPKHPGYPKDAADGKGGQFRPKDTANREMTSDRFVLRAHPASESLSG